MSVDGWIGEETVVYIQLCVSQQTGKFFKRWECQTTWHSSWEICQEATVRTGHGTGSKLGKEYVKVVYCHLAYSTYMQSTSGEMPGLMKHKLESRLLGEISVT